MTNSTTVNEDNTKKEVTGYEPTTGGLEKTPLREITIREEKRSLADVVRRIDKEYLILNPDFQRNFVWDQEQKSKLIESIIMRIPLPVFYLAENNDGKLVVVDGLQRLTTIKQFASNQFFLKLEKNSELNKKSFSELAVDLQNRFEDCQLLFFVIPKGTEQQACLDIFERVNGGEYLTRQQMRNAIYNGKSTKFLRDQAENEIFIEVTGHSLSQKTMQDREFINRFCAFLLFDLNEYTKKEMDRWLGDALEKINKFSEDELANLTDSLHRSLKNNQCLFGKHAFRKFTHFEQQRNPINASLFDCMSSGLAFYSAELVEQEKERLLVAYLELLRDEEFDKSISSSTNSPDRVKTRHEKSRKMLREVLGDPVASPYKF